MNLFKSNRNAARWERAKNRPLLYVAGPMTSSGNPYLNVREGVLAGRRAAHLGWVPFIPHLSAVGAMIDGHADWEEALEYDYAIIQRAAALLLLPGPSLGAEAELDLAAYLGLPVFGGVHDLPTAAAFIDGTWGVQ